MTILVIKTAINMGPALKKKEKTRSKKTYIINREIIHMKRDKKTKTRIHIQLLKISAPL